MKQTKQNQKRKFLIKLILLKKTKLTELESKVQDVSSLATKTALTTAENKISDVRSLVRKANYDTKISDLEKKLSDHNHDKYITTPEFNALTADHFNCKISTSKFNRKRQILMLNCQVLTEKLIQINQNIYLLQMS